MFLLNMTALVYFSVAPAAPDSNHTGYVNVSVSDTPSGLAAPAEKMTCSQEDPCGIRQLTTNTNELEPATFLVNFLLASSLKKCECPPQHDCSRKKTIGDKVYLYCQDKIEKLTEKLEKLSQLSNALNNSIELNFTHTITSYGDKNESSEMCSSNDTCGWTLKLGDLLQNANMTKEAFSEYKNILNSKKICYCPKNQDCVGTGIREGTGMYVHRCREIPAQIEGVVANNTRETNKIE